MLTARNGADVGRKPVSDSVLQQHCKFAGPCILLTRERTLHYKMYQGSQLLKRADVGGAEQTIASIGREHRDGCNVERNHRTAGEFGHFPRRTDHDGRREREEEEKQSNGKMQ